MRVIYAITCLAAVLLGTWAMVPVRAQTEDVFNFIPDGGRTLLAQVFEAGGPADQEKAILTGKHDSPDAWLSDLKARAASLPGLKDLDDIQLETLADYLSFHMPLPADKIPADFAKADWSKVLPHDARDVLLTHCQSCHIITVVVTQYKTKASWLNTMNHPSHVEIEISKAEREALANYLVLNAEIPIDQVPEELRAGGASY